MEVCQVDQGATVATGLQWLRWLHWVVLQRVGGGVESDGNRRDDRTRR
jgi:hypothetical protein